MVRISWSAGHGLNTSGKRTPDGMREWEFNSAVVVEAIKLLDQYQNVLQLRLDDPTGQRDVPLQERSNRSNSWDADVHIDVHANAFGNGGWNKVQGIETFVYTTRPPMDVTLATNVQTRLIANTKRPDRGVKADNFHMLRETTAVSILVECGFMTNKEEAALLKSAAYRKLCAQSIIEGLVETYNLKLKEEDFVLERAIVINSFADFPVTELLANYVKAPIYTRRVAENVKLAKELLVVGGNTEGLQADRIILLAGRDRFETAARVKEYIG
ncbi:N-acetylmuramoyl-L-alanine amidase [Bacillus sp. CHD6a]|uniref:N-acetylmuramoyl-L-alanine amidase n=1 Tax=Bacillus sp. CHD6a TaxID=1643452 RepID=UPI000760EE0F|nr:N-acetylmuramoyl-L-alanine amidase [Bacillus sp. CHD6a]